MSPACGGMGFGMKVSPNPAKGNIYVTIEGYADANKKHQIEKTIFQLYELNSGNLVKRWTVNKPVNRQRLDIYGIKPGLYILVAQNGKQLQTQKVIVE